MVKIVKVDYKIMGLSGGNIAFRVYHDVRVVSLISEEWRYSSGGVRGIVVHEFGNG